MATTDILHICGSMNPSYPSVAFLGGATDDYVQIDASAVAQVAGSYAFGTWIAKVMPVDRTSTMTIIGAGDKNAVEFIELNIEAGKLVARCTDATVAQWVVTTDAEACPPHTWTEVALVQDGSFPKLYVNGVFVAQTISTATDNVAWFDQTAGIDSMRIGAANKAGDDSVTQEFGGGIAEIKIYGSTTNEAALTAAKILDNYNRKFTTTSLYNHYRWGDYLLTDAGTGADNGTIVGAVVQSDCYCEFESRFRTKGLVTADYPVIAVHGGEAHCMVIKAA